MAKFDITEFNYITSGKTQNTFNVSFCYTDDGMISENVKKPSGLSAIRTTTFFGDVGEYNSMSQKYASNEESFYDIDNKVIMHNLYELPRSRLKTTAMKYSSLSVSTSKLDLFVPHISDDFINVAQFDGYAYALTKMLDSDPLVISVVMNNDFNFDVTYHFALSSGDIQTFLCPQPNEVRDAGYSTYQDLIDNAHSLSDAVLSDIFKVKRELSTVHHNYIIEIPETKKYNEYTKGFIQCDQIVAKNHLDYTYTMSVDNNYNLLSCRDYCNIGVCGGQLYMTYRDNVNYNNRNGGSGTVVYNDNVEAGDYDETIYSIGLKKQQDVDSYSYQHIEVIDSWNRWDGSANAGHKSSLFSLRLINTGLNEATINEVAKAKLRQNIKNNVRSIIENIIPANTQLFNIYFEGK